MRVLVVFASRYGSTQGIAERIAATLRRHGLHATVKPAHKSVNPALFDAAIIGSAAYFYHWMKPATRFVQRNTAALAGRPVWLFTSGLLGTHETDSQGRQLRVLMEPREIAGFRQSLKPRDHLVFFGAMTPRKLGFFHRLIFKSPANRRQNLFPEGDFRDWDNIDAWARMIARDLQESSPARRSPLRMQGRTHEDGSSDPAQYEN